MPFGRALVFTRWTDTDAGLGYGPAGVTPSCLCRTPYCQAKFRTRLRPALSWCDLGVGGDKVAQIGLPAGTSLVVDIFVLKSRLTCQSADGAIFMCQCATCARPAVSLAGLVTPRPRRLCFAGTD